MLQRYWGHLWREMSETGRRTLPWDLLHGMAGGAVVTVQATFGLVVAIQYFDAGPLQKSLIAGAHALGLMLSLPYAAWSPALGRKTVRGAAPILGQAVGLTLAACASNAMFFTAGMVLYGVSLTMPVPVMTAIYRDNYRGIVRGQVVGLTTFATIAAGLVVQAAGGRALESALENYRIIFLVLAVLTIPKAMAIMKMPSKAGEDPVLPNPLHSFGAIRDNPMFGFVLFAWFLFGLANLALQPQRFELVSQPQYGFELSAGMVVLIVGVTTEVTRLLVIPVWARLFDHMNFIWVRMLLNLALMTNMILFFHTPSLAVLVLASVALGIAFGGGAIAWTLWVTKFAPPEQTARYMSIHTFLTGVRGSVGPLLGYMCVEYLTLQTTAWIGAVMVALSTVLLFPIRNRVTRADTGNA